MVGQQSREPPQATMTRAVIAGRNLLVPTLVFSGMNATSGADRAYSSTSKVVNVDLSGGDSWLHSVEKPVGYRLGAEGAKIAFIGDALQGDITKVFAARGGPIPFDVLEGGPNFIQVAQRADGAKTLSAAALPD